MNKWKEFVNEWDQKETYGFEKYFDICTCLEKKLRVVKHLGLDTLKPIRILDISTGFGFFPYLCKLFGHEIHLTDCIDKKSMVSVAAREALGLPVAIHFKYPRNRVNHEFIPLPEFKEKFDLISALACAPQSHWQPVNWSCFIADALMHLNNKGRIYLEPNRSEGLESLLMIIDNYTHTKYLNGVLIWKN